MKTRLPLLVERSIAEARTARTELAESHKVRLQGHLADGDANVTCRKGCHHCCYHPVLATLFEGVSLYLWLHENNFWTKSLKDRLKKVSEQTHNLSFEVWSLSLLPCPLLEGGLCKAYEARPFACRVTYSIGDPQNCHPHTLGPGMLPKRELFERLTVQESEILHRHHLGHFRIPLAAALLYGELIARGELDLEDAGKALWELP
jgi:Fe-S-cluster containining protein